jgi:alpha-ribazole phosphatase/probable phosphoglycerate mutase
MSETTGLVFIRHAETALSGTFCGHTDPPLDARGQAQVSALIAQLASQRFDTVHTSDLRRATETAQALAAACEIPCITTAKLREIDFGRWEGLRWSQIEAQDPEYAQRWIAAFPALPAPDGEPFAAFERRVLDEVARLLRLAEEQRIAVVTHGGVMRVILQNVLCHTAQQAWDLTRPFCSFFALQAANAREEVLP